MGVIRVVVRMRECITQKTYVWNVYYAKEKRKKKIAMQIGSKYDVHGIEFVLIYF